MAGAGRASSREYRSSGGVSGLPSRHLHAVVQRGEHHKKGEKQPLVTCNKSTVKTAEQAVRNLRLKIETEHAGCIAAAEVARAAAAGPMSYLHTRDLRAASRCQRPA